MKKSRFSESQIVTILKEAEAGVSLEELSRQHGFSKTTFYKWKARYSGMDVSTSNACGNWKTRTAGSSRCMPS